MKEVVLAAFVALSAAFSFAGVRLQYECSNTNCHFTGSLKIGGGFSFDKVSGFCTTCKKFVSIAWDRDGTTDKSARPERPPVKLGTVWNPTSGRTADLYPCPICKKPFMEVESTDFWVLLDRIVGLVGVTDGWDEEKKDSKATAQAVSRVCMDLLKERMQFCPACTNLTLKVRDDGWFD